MWYFNDHCGNSHSSPGLAEASWEGTSWDGAPSALSSLLPIRAAHCSHDSVTDTCRIFPSGMMFARSMATLGADQLTSLLEGFPARTSRSLARAMASMGSDQDCGPKWPGSSARLNLNSCSWRTAQCSLLGGFTEYGQTWPRWGTMEDMELWELPTPAALMAEIASGSSPITSAWPTPTCADAYTHNLKSTQQREGSMHSVNLSQAVGIKWPTPVAMDSINAMPHRVELINGRASTISSKGRRGTSPLSTSVRVGPELAWPTPCAHGRGGAQTPGSHLSLEKAVAGWNKDGTKEERETPRASPSARDWKDSPGMSKAGKNPDGSTRSREDQLARQVTGVLNPEWEEALMCWPVGWTSLDPLPELRWPWRDFSGFVALRGRPQHDWEPPRTVEKLKHRNARVKAVGNGQDVSAIVLAVTVLSRMTTPKKMAA